MKYPAFSINSDTVHLTDNPLDDYQRLYLVSVLDRDSPPASFSAGLNIRKVNYKSSIAAQFTRPNFIISARDAGNGEEAAAQNVLNCFEYQFPNLQTIQSLVHEQTLLSQLASSTTPHSALHLHDKNILMGKIILPSRSNKTPVSASPTKQEKKALSTASRENATSSLTKNQQFKLTKMDHNLINDKLINPNNCVIWSHDSGYVFMTGIWRLYQDVMKGLINLPRSDSVSTSQQQFFCKAEFEKILSFCFYNHSSFTSEESSSVLLSSSTSSPPKRRKSTGSTFLDANASSSSTSSTQANNYIDFHWNNIKPELRDLICQSYKDFLINELGPDQIDLPNLNPANFTKRIRGGYIKIQGTWLPMEISRLLCLRFSSFYNTHGHRYSYPGNIYIPQQRYSLPPPNQLSSPQRQLNYTYDHIHPVPSQYQSPRHYNVPFSPIAPAPPTFPQPYGDDYYHFLKYASEVYKQQNQRPAHNTNTNMDTSFSPRANNSLNNFKFKTNSKQ
ncbi:ANL_HP_G0196260.mRNA.1.CDS.1 [Saccharomyces cerevisiae]|nr:ANL_HP_G0196260.mRNA.1.CDS.1 [Saccharomyces cerevisiae]CAI6442420.1 ANL_HP_G0196260.mRNA.1.CDS.1 [Saccharomyces cerevisiae]